MKIIVSRRRQLCSHIVDGVCGYCRQDDRKIKKALRIDIVVHLCLNTLLASFSIPSMKNEIIVNRKKEKKKLKTSFILFFES